MQKIIIKINNIVYKIHFFRDNKGNYHYTIERNKKGKLASMTPPRFKNSVKMFMFRNIKELIEYDIINEIEKLKIKC